MYTDIVDGHGIQDHHALCHQDQPLGPDVWHVIQQRLDVGVAQVVSIYQLDIGIHADEVLLHAAGHQLAMLLVAGDDHHGHALTSFAVTGHVLSGHVCSGLGLGVRCFSSCHGLSVLGLLNGSVSLVFILVHNSLI